MIDSYSFSYWMFHSSSEFFISISCYFSFSILWLIAALSFSFPLFQSNHQLFITTTGLQSIFQARKTNLIDFHLSFTLSSSHHQKSALRHETFSFRHLSTSHFIHSHCSFSFFLSQSSIPAIFLNHHFHPFIIWTKFYTLHWMFLTSLVWPLIAFLLASPFPICWISFIDTNPNLIDSNSVTFSIGKFLFIPIQMRHERDDQW